MHAAAIAPEDGPITVLGTKPKLSRSSKYTKVVALREWHNTAKMLSISLRAMLHAMLLCVFTAVAAAVGSNERYSYTQRLRADLLASRRVRRVNGLFRRRHRDL